MKKYLVLAMFVVLAVVLVSPISVSAKTKVGVKSGSFFYFFDKAFEKADLFFTFSPEKKAKKALDNAEERLAEAEESASENKPEAVSEAMQDYQKNIEVLEKVLNKVPEEAKKAIEKAIEADKERREEMTKKIEEINNEIKKEGNDLKKDEEEKSNDDVSDNENNEEEKGNGNKDENKKDEQKKEIEKLKTEVETLKQKQIVPKQPTLESQNSQEQKKTEEVRNNAEETTKKLQVEIQRIEEDFARTLAEYEEKQKEQEENKIKAELEQRLAEEQDVRRNTEEESTSEILTSPLSGNIVHNSKLVLKNSPYIITGTVQVLESVLLEIEPGVILKFNNNLSLNIGGALIARGSVNNKIIFTSNNDVPQPGDWGGIRFVDSSIDAIFDNQGNYLSGSILEYADISFGGLYGQSGVYAVIDLHSASPFISHNIIHNNQGGQAGGIYAEFSRAKITHNEIINNATGIYGGGISATYNSELLIEHNNIMGNTTGEGVAPSDDAGGIYCYMAKPTIQYNNIVDNNNLGHGGGITVAHQNAIINYNNIYGNGEYNLYHYRSNGETNAQNNWWGSGEVQFVEEKIWDYQDDISLGRTNHEPVAISEFKEAGIQ